ncbi:MAG: efflux RND transporter permease subunit, partial [Longimicrobiales bacterium]
AATLRQPVISLIFAGDQDLSTLHGLAEQAREELLELPEVTQVDLSGVPPLELSIEVRREDLEAYGLTLEQIAAQIRMASIDLPGGGVETSSGEVLVRVVDRRLTAEGFADVVIRGTAQRHELRLGDIATIVDGYEDTHEATQFGGAPAVQLTVYRVGDQTPTEVATAVKSYAERLRARVPANVTLSTWSDDSEILEDRINLLFKNAVMGLGLVLVVLTLFLSRRLAGWVALGIPISFLGAFMLMGPLDVSINMMTLFALIITLGLVVDDAIIVSENVYRRAQEGMGRLQAAVQGAREMSMPVTFSVLTTMVAFAPLLFVPGVMGKFFRLIPIVVMGVLFFSLIESFYVLPAHLGHKHGRGWRGGARLMGPIDRVQGWVTRGLDRFIEERYRPLLGTLLEHRYTTIASAVAILLITIGVVAGGVVPFAFFPQIEADVVTASARLPFGAPVERTLAVRAELQTALDLAIEESGGSASIRGIISRVGQGPTQFGPSLGGGERLRGSHLVSLEVNLVPQDQREFSATQFEERWRAHVPALAELEALTITSAGGPSAGAAVDVQLSHADEDVLAEASRELTNRLRDFPALINIDNSYASGKPQLDFRLLPEAAGLGLTSTDVARAIRSSFFGAEALREQRGRNEIKVMVRLPEEQRASEQDVEDLIVMTPTGAVPVLYAAEFTRGRSPTRITREDGRRTVNVTAELAP